jgi:hypothetical protein
MAVEGGEQSFAPRPPNDRVGEIAVIPDRTAEPTQAGGGDSAVLSDRPNEGRIQLVAPIIWGLLP